MLAPGVPAGAETQAWGWAYQVLPFIEQRAVWENPNDPEVPESIITTYCCPTLRPPTKFWYAQAGVPGYHVMADYVGNGGSWGTWDYFDGGTHNALDGPISPSGHQVSMAAIRDGTANTLLVGEKYVNPLGGGPACNDDQGWVDGWDNDTISFSRGTSPTGTITAPLPDGRVSGCWMIFGSPHSTLLTVFCDGSGHSVTFDIDPNIWVRMCSGQDGDPFSMRDL